MMKHLCVVTLLCSLNACATSDPSAAVVGRQVVDDAGTTVELALGFARDAGDDAGVAADSGLSGRGCPAGSAAELMGCVDGSHYQQNLEKIAGVRTHGSAHWAEVQELCAQQLSSFGFTVERHTYSTGVNVIGVLPGGDLSSEHVVVSAHYDHIPNCSGADDNASGVAGALEAARVLSSGHYRRSLVVACWDQEEAGLLGSRAWVTRAKKDNVQIATAFVFEMIGYRSTKPNSQLLPFGFGILLPAQVRKIHENQNRGDFVALIADDRAHAALTRFVAHAQEVALPSMSVELTNAQKNQFIYAQLRRSDHAAFWGHDYGAMMIGDTANYRNLHYHCVKGPDEIVDLDQAFATQIVTATVGAAADALEVQH